MTPEKETHTPKTVEEVVEEFTKKTDPDNYEVGEYHYLKDNGESLLDTSWYPESPYELDGDKIVDWLRTILQARDQAADERLREVVGQARELITRYGGKLPDSEAIAIYEGLKTIAAKHGITNL